MRRLRWPVALAVWIVSAAAALAADTGWQEAIARLAYERTRAETCVKALKTYGDEAAKKRGEIAYGEAKAEYDGIIQGLVVALARKGEPASISDLEDRMQRGFKAREAFCRDVQPLVPSRHGQRGVIADIMNSVVTPLIEAVKAIWLRSKDDDALMRKTIETQLEATLWPPFASVSPSS